MPSACQGRHLSSGRRIGHPCTYHSFGKLPLSTCSLWGVSWVLRLQLWNKTMFWALVPLTCQWGTDRQQIINIISKPNSRLGGNECCENRRRTRERGSEVVDPTPAPKDSLVKCGWSSIWRLTLAGASAPGAHVCWALKVIPRGGVILEYVCVCVCACTRMCTSGCETGFLNSRWMTLN